MASRTVTDSEGRTWMCASAPSTTEGGSDAAKGQDVTLSCTTESVSAPVELKVGWQWEKMAPTGLARLVSQASGKAE